MNDKFFDLKKEKQDKILNAALKVFAENGFRRASTDEMVKEAEISKGLLFHYFSSKMGLFVFVYIYSVKYFVMEMASSVNSKEHSYFKVRRQIERAKAKTMKHFPYMQMFLRQAEKEDAPEIVPYMRAAAEQLIGTYDKLYSSVDFKGIDKISSEHLVKITEYTLNGLMEEKLEEADFKAEDYYKEACFYLQELEQLCMQPIEEEPESEESGQAES